MLDGIRSPSAQQEAFVGGIIGAIAFLDEPMFRGKWKVIRTTPDEPFILSDAPIVTWEREQSGDLSFGLGFHNRNVEVLFPISASTCLHILPRVERTRALLVLRVHEVNLGEASFAHQACFANRNLKAIDDTVQEQGERFGSVRTHSRSGTEITTMLFTIS
jgi:hypothetical protein